MIVNQKRNDMKLTHINTNRQTNFQGAYRLSIQKRALSDVISDYDNEILAEKYFQYITNSIARKIPKVETNNKPKNLLKRLFPCFNKNEPEVLIFLNFPGYKDLNHALKGRTINWLNQHLESRYGLGNTIKFCEFDKNTYNLVVLTKEERNTYLKDQGKIKINAAYFVRGVIKKFKNNNDNLANNDINILENSVLAFLKNVKLLSANGNRPPLEMIGHTYYTLEPFLKDLNKVIQI